LPRRLATIDLGTNTVRVLVVEAEGLQWRPLYQAQRVTRLGERRDLEGRLLEEPMRRTVQTVAEFVVAAHDRGARDVHVVATSAVREAPNRDDFVARVRAATGHGVEVISGDDEAGLTLEGVTAALPELPGSFMLCDIGGGSTELVLARDRQAPVSVSLGLGVVPLAERFMDPGPVSPERLRLMHQAVGARLDADLPARIGMGRASALVGTAGTVTTLAALDLGLVEYDADRVHGHVLRRGDVARLLTRLATMTLAERAALPVVEPGRADVLVPGIAICLGIMARLGHESLIVSDHGLREGILLNRLRR
jgi:exopolyphosphatase / guanosine-5'-triphosphate,3'-diphosphate pyrophosphatase